MNYRTAQYFGCRDHCGSRHERRRDPVGPADVVAGMGGAKLCPTCWWRAARGDWEPLAAEWFIWLAREAFPGSEEL